MIVDEGEQQTQQTLGGGNGTRIASHESVIQTAVPGN